MRQFSSLSEVVVYVAIIEQKNELIFRTDQNRSGSVKVSGGKHWFTFRTRSIKG